MRALHLLIVDDDPHLRELLPMLAERTGKFARITVACDGQDAWERILRELGRDPANVPDYILSDLSMPRMDGIELIRRLKQNPATKPIPIVTMTSSDRPNDREDALASGCSAFFSKPIGLEEFTALIGSLPDICEAAVPPTQAGGLVGFGARRNKRPSPQARF